ncbi:MAG: T9SS type A sorting domain-containing protein [Ignavibacteriales bacterium]|nr:T9SS type A sorting domain-containing protein [Ignavibacteriales bacterium]
MTDSYGNVHKTTNTGFTWQSKNIGQEVLSSVKFLNEQFGYITASSGYVFITTNQGATWKTSHTGQQSSLFAAHFISPVYGWVAGADGVILSTSDGGTTWKKHNSNSSHDLESIFSNGKQVWATGDFATIINLVLDDSLVTGYHSEKNLTPVEFKLFQNYPNPFNPSTKVTFSLPEENKVVIKVFNAMGEQVKEIDRGFLVMVILNRILRWTLNLQGMYFCQVLCTNTISGRTKSLRLRWF